MKALLDRIQASVRRVVVTGVDSSKKMQELQVELLADETLDEVEHVEPYGLTSRPKVGAEGIAVAVGGLRSHTLVLNVGDRRFRLKGLDEGEVALYDDQEQVVFLKRDGILIHGKKLTFESEGDIAFTGEKLLFDVDQFKVNSDDVLLGTGAALFAARKTDTVASGAITGGSTKVKIA